MARGHLRAFTTTALVLGCSAAAVTKDFSRLAPIRYDPTLLATSVLTAHGQETSRRLETAPLPTAPVGWIADRVTLVANPFEFFLKQNDTAVIIYGADVQLTDLTEDFLWSPHLDLEVYSMNLQLPAMMKFEGKRDRKVFLHSRVINVAAEGSTIDVTGEVGWSTPVRADDGIVQFEVPNGEPGENGKDGGRGEDGGSIFIIAQKLIGGDLTLKVNGGMGGAGQAGGHGARGLAGEAGSRTACCSDPPSSSNGLPGHRGGTGGNGGHGGTGGNAGAIVLRVAESIPMSVMTYEASGPGGLRGIRGQAGPGGYGGPGSGTNCVKLDWWGLDKRCFPPFAPPGADGELGVDGHDGLEGGIGEGGTNTQTQESIEYLQEGQCGDHIQYSLNYADRMYMSANTEADLLNVLALYQWIDAVSNRTDAQCGSRTGYPAKWTGLMALAATRIAQLVQQRDFWNYRQDFTSSLTFDTLLSQTEPLILLAKDAEAAFQTYYAAKTENDERISLITKALHNLDYEVGQAASKVRSLAEEITGVRDEIKIMDEALAEVESSLMFNGSTCDQGIRLKAARENYGGLTGVSHVMNFLKNTLTFSISVAQQATTFAIGAIAIWGAVSAFLPTAMTIGAAAFGGPGIAGAAALIAGAQNPINTLVSGVTRLGGEGQTLFTNVDTEFGAVSSSWTAAKDALDSRLVLMMAMSDQDKVLQEFVYSIPECVPFKATMDIYTIDAAQLNAKVAEHDTLVLQLAETEATRQKRTQQRKDLEIRSSGTFDPTGMSFMQSIGESFQMQKNNLIANLKMLRSALNYESCDNELFSYKDMTVFQLEVGLHDLVAERRKVRMYTASGGGVIAQNPGTLTSGRGQKAEAHIKIVVKDTDENMAGHFSDYVSTGNFFYTLPDGHPAFPTGVSNLRIVSAQAYVPGLDDTTDNVAQVWLSRYGSSTCHDELGTARTFSHPPKAFYSMYRKNSNGQPRWLTRAHQTGAVSPTPVGAWKVSTPGATDKDRESVREFQLHLVVSYVAKRDIAAARGLGSDAGQAPTQLSDAAASRTQLIGVNPTVSGAAFVSLGTVGAILILFAAAGLVAVRRTSQTQMA